MAINGAVAGRVRILRLTSWCVSAISFVRGVLAGVHLLDGGLTIIHWLLLKTVAVKLSLMTGGPPLEAVAMTAMSPVHDHGAVGVEGAGAIVGVGAPGRLARAPIAVRPTTGWRRSVERWCVRRGSTVGSSFSVVFGICASRWQQQVVASLRTRVLQCVCIGLSQSSCRTMLLVRWAKGSFVRCVPCASLLTRYYWVSHSLPPTTSVSA